MPHNDNDLEKFLQSRDTSQFSTESYVRKVVKPWGWEIHFVPDGLPYMGKFLHIDEGKRVSLQLHDNKQESWILLNGAVSILVELPDGSMKEVSLTADSGYTIAKGQKHRLVGGKGGGEVIEVSTPELGTTYRLDDDYNRPNETEELRLERNRNLTDTLQ